MHIHKPWNGCSSIRRHSAVQRYAALLYMIQSICILVFIFFGRHPTELPFSRASPNCIFHSHAVINNYVADHHLTGLTVWMMNARAVWGDQILDLHKHRFIRCVSPWSVYHKTFLLWQWLLLEITLLCSCVTWTHAHIGALPPWKRRRLFFFISLIDFPNKQASTYFHPPDQGLTR